MRWEAAVWRVHEYRGQELLSCWSATEEEHALEAAGRYAQDLADQGWELTPEELPDGTRRVRATLNGEARLITIEARER